jgi:acyl-CoA thioesterase-1
MQPAYAAPRLRIQWAIGWLLLLLAFTAPAQQPQTAPRPAPGTPPTVLVMGDSLSAAHGLSADEGWVSLLAGRIAREKPGWRVVNASISGETTDGGSSRIVGELLRVRPAVVVIELGANDGLRGLPLRAMRHNLARMIGASQYVGAKVLLVGMRIPPNYGADYADGFARAYADLAKHFDVALLPFLLEPVAADRANFQDDNLHPVAAAQPALRDHVWKQLAPLLD